jgi:hypothetical protein
MGMDEVILDRIALGCCEGIGRALFEYTQTALGI